MDRVTKRRRGKKVVKRERALRYGALCLDICLRAPKSLVMPLEATSPHLINPVRT